VKAPKLDLLREQTKETTMSLSVLIAVALMVPQETNEAEKLFKKMEEKIAKAATIRVKMAGALEAMKLTLTGDLLMGEGARMRVDLEGKLQEQVMKAGLICDGKRLRLESSDKPDAKFFDVPEKMGEPARSSLARGGLQGVLDSFDSEEGVKATANDLFAVSAFTMGAKEKVGEREGQAVNYKLEKKGHPTSETTVWIDTETQLPLKRVIKMAGMVLNETYSEFKVGEKIDPAKFELPKETK
jgi:outer membrane lipoprotein-sorting protein